MKNKVAKYLIAGVKAKEKQKLEKKFDKQYAPIKAELEKKTRWWNEDFDRRKELEEEVAKLKDELAEKDKVIAGYKETMAKDLGISEEAQNA